MCSTCPQSFGKWTIVWHLTKPSSRQHLEFLGIPSNTDPWRNRFLLQFHSLHTPTTKECNFEWELCDLDESCTKVCCEFVEVQDMLACQALEWKVCFTACSGGALEKSSQSQLMWKESGHAYIEKVLLSAIKGLPSWMLLINNCLVSLTALKFKIFTFYG